MTSCASPLYDVAIIPCYKSRIHCMCKKSHIFKCDLSILTVKAADLAKPRGKTVNLFVYARWVIKCVTPIFGQYDQAISSEYA